MTGKIIFHLHLISDKNMKFHVYSLKKYFLRYQIIIITEEIIIEKLTRKISELTICLEKEIKNFHL